MTTSILEEKTVKILECKDIYSIEQNGFKDGSYDFNDHVLIKKSRRIVNRNRKL